MISFNTKLALRNLIKNKVYSFLIIGGFSIGFAACILIGLYYFSEHSVNRNFSHYNQIYRLYDETNESYQIDYELYSKLQNDYPEIRQACPMGYLSGMEFTVKDEQSNSNIRISELISTNNSFFTLFEPEVTKMLGATPFEGRESVIITESVARRLFGNENALGRKIIIHQMFSATVTAVIKELPENSSFKAEILLNSDNESFRIFQSTKNGRRIYVTNHFLLVRNDADIKKLTATINTAISDGETFALQNLADIYLSPATANDMHARGNRKMLTIFLFIALLIVVLSSINYFNYIITIQYSKLKITGIKKTIGASTRYLFSAIITEVTVGVLLSLMISLLIVFLLLPYSEVLFGKELLPLQAGVVKLIPVLLAIIIVVILVNSIAPVYLLSRFNVTEFLSGLQKKGGKQLGKQAMLTFQITVSVALIAVVLIIFKQLEFVKNHDLGFNKELLVRIDLPFNHPNLATLKKETEKFPFVKNSTLSFGCPGMINNRMGSNTGEKSFMLDCIYIDENFLQTMNIELIEGRQLMKGDFGKVCFINEEAFEKFGWDNLENRKYNSGREGGYEVVGVVKDFHVKSLHQKISPTALLYDLQNGEYNVLSVRLAPGKTGQYIEQIREVWGKVIPDETMNFTFYDDQFQMMYEKEERLAKSITFFSIVAIVLTCMGILGQIYLVSLSRIKEIGIRKVNGARTFEILTMLNKDFVKWVGFAFVIATPIAYFAMHKWLENFAYKTSLSWWIFALAGLLALGIALLTVSWQSWRAATRNPVEALRYE
jgi:putative ABC transport system permease protein